MIGVNNLTRYYGTFRAVNNVSFEVNDGEIVGVLGLNGAGKSTILKVLAGLLSPSSGTVTIDGIDVTMATDELKSRIGYLPEAPPQYLDMTVTEFLAYMGRLKGMSSAEVTRRMPEVIEQCALSGREHQVIGTHPIPGRHGGAGRRTGPPASGSLCLRPAHRPLESPGDSLPRGCAQHAPRAHPLRGRGQALRSAGPTPPEQPNAPGLPARGGRGVEERRSPSHRGPTHRGW